MKRAFRIFKKGYETAGSQSNRNDRCGRRLSAPIAVRMVNIAANMDPYGNTGAVQIAVANLDKGTENELTGSLNAGEEIVDQLKENHDLGWKFVQKRRGCRRGEIRQVLCCDRDSGRFQ